MFIELGVFKGTTATIIGNKMSEEGFAQKLHAFDCFDGLPENWRNLEAGTFSVDDMPNVPENVELIDGLFKDTLPVFTSENKDKKITLLHMDADLYSSTYESFRDLHHMFRSGTIVAFDEFAFWPNFHKGKQSEFEALIDASRDFGFEYEYVMRGWDDEDSKKIRCGENASILKMITLPLGFIETRNLSREEPKHSAREKAVIRIL